MTITAGVDITANGGLLLPIGLPGQGYDFNPRDVVSRTNSATAPIVMGNFVADVTPQNCKPIAGDGDVPSGIAMQAAETLLAQWPQYATVPVLRKGYVCALAAEDATEGDDVVAVVANGGQPGSAAAGAVGAGRLATKAKWVTTTKANDVGVIRLDF